LEKFWGESESGGVVKNGVATEPGVDQLDPTQEIHILSSPIEINQEGGLTNRNFDGFMIKD
jgi:hypothetical protein